MAEDDLDIVDIEEAIRTASIKRIQQDDPRGRCCVFEGHAFDGTTPVGVVGRFPGHDRFLSVTVYKVT